MTESEHSDEQYLEMARESLRRAAESAKRPTEELARAVCIDTNDDGDFTCACPTCGHKFVVAFSEADAKRVCRICNGRHALPTKSMLSATYSARVVNPRVPDDAVDQIGQRVADEEESKSHAIGCAFLTAIVVAIVAAASADAVDKSAQGGAIIGGVLGVLTGVSVPNTDGQSKFFAALLCGSLFGIGGAMLAGVIGIILA